MAARLPSLSPSKDKGYIYVAQRGDVFKIGFSRAGVPRRLRDCGGRLVLTIPTGQQPASLGRAIHQRFAGKRASGPVFKQEWFALNETDLDWLKGLAKTLSLVV